MTDTPTHKRIRRSYWTLCRQCKGSGIQVTKDGVIQCPAPGCVCGEVETWLTEIVNEDEGDRDG